MISTLSIFWIHFELIHMQATLVPIAKVVLSNYKYHRRRRGREKRKEKTNRREKDMTKDEGMLVKSQVVLRKGAFYNRGLK